MRPTTITAAALAGLLLLAGCGGQEAAQEPAPQTTSPAVTTSPSPTETEEPTEPDLPEGHAACAAFAEGGDESLMQRIPGALTGIGASLSDAQLNELLDIHAGLDVAADQAPADLAAALRRLNEPFQQVADVIDAGGGQLSMDTSHVMEDITAVMSTCVDYGYTLGGSE